MTKLSVNVNKVATLRNARGKENPNVLATALRLIDLGAQGITVHPRPDERHIRWTDVEQLREHISSVEFNIEGYPSNEFLMKVTDSVPEQCTLVPDPPEVLTSNAGWRLAGNEKLLENSVPLLRERGSRVSLFIDPYTITTPELIHFRDLGVERVELYTESYALAYGTEKQVEVTKLYKDCAELCSSMGLEINAGHDLNLENLKTFVTEVPNVLEVSIGHALVCDALEYGWGKTIQKYLMELRK